MNSTLLKAAIVFVPVSALFSYSLVVFVRRKTVPSVLQLFGAACLLLVVLTHVPEALHVFPAMGWGEPDSVGHYVDLSSAVGGIAVTAGAVTFRLLRYAR